jgi:hypothetical protein
MKARYTYSLVFKNMLRNERKFKRQIGSYVILSLFFFSFLNIVERIKKWIVKKDIQIYINDNKMVMKLGPISLIDSWVQLMIQV